MKLFTWIKGLGRRAFNSPCGSGEITRAQWDAMRTAFPKAPTKPQPTGGRLIHVDRDPGPVNQSAPAPAEMPSDELMSRWREECRQLSGDSDYAIPASSFMVQRVVAWTRQQQAQSIKLPPPSADPVATDEELVEELADLWPGCMPSAVRRAIYEKGRADERAAIAKALGAEP